MSSIDFHILSEEIFFIKNGEQIQIQRTFLIGREIVTITRTLPDNVPRNETNHEVAIRQLGEIYERHYFLERQREYRRL